MFRGQFHGCFGLACLVPVPNMWPVEMSKTAGMLVQTDGLGWLYVHAYMLLGLPVKVFRTGCWRACFIRVWGRGSSFRAVQIHRTMKNKHSCRSVAHAIRLVVWVKHVKGGSLDVQCDALLLARRAAASRHIDPSACESCQCLVLAPDRASCLMMA